jgi:predicted dehydrogenase
MYEWSRMEAFVLLVQDFIDAVVANREPPVTGFDGLAAIAMVEASYRSAESGEAIKLDLRPAAGAQL